MSSIMAMHACTSFQEHAWKRGICANCKQTKIKHSGYETGSTTTEEKPTVSPKKKTTCTVSMPTSSSKLKEDNKNSSTSPRASDGVTSNAQRVSLQNGTETKDRLKAKTAANKTAALSKDTVKTQGNGAAKKPPTASGVKKSIISSTAHGTKKSSVVGGVSPTKTNRKTMSRQISETSSTTSKTRAKSTRSSSINSSQSSLPSRSESTSSLASSRSGYSLNKNVSKSNVTSKTGTAAKASKSKAVINGTCINGVRTPSSRGINGGNNSNKRQGAVVEAALKALTATINTHSTHNPKAAAQNPLSTSENKSLSTTNGNNNNTLSPTAVLENKGNVNRSARTSMNYGAVGGVTKEGKTKLNDSKSKLTDNIRSANEDKSVIKVTTKSVDNKTKPSTNKTGNSKQESSISTTNPTTKSPTSTSPVQNNNNNKAGGRSVNKTSANQSTVTRPSSVAPRTPGQAIGQPNSSSTVNNNTSQPSIPLDKNAPPSKSNPGAVLVQNGAAENGPVDRNAELNGAVAYKTTKTGPPSPQDKTDKISTAKNSQSKSRTSASKVEQPKSVNKKSKPESVKNKSQGGGTKVIGKRKCIVDKGRLSTEKVILDDALIVSRTTKTNDKLSTKLSGTNKAESAANKPTKRSIFSSGNKHARDNNSKTNSHTSPHAAFPATSRSTAMDDNKNQCAIDQGDSTVKRPGAINGEVQGEEGNARSSGEKRMDSNGDDSLVKSHHAEGKSSKNTTSQPQGSSELTSNKNKSSPSHSENVTRDTRYTRSSSNTSTDGQSTTNRRSRSRSSRPAAPPPSLPPPGAVAKLASTTPPKAMSESYHSQTSTDKITSPKMKRNSTALSGSNNDDGSFSDLYSDIVNTLSSNKDITPDLLMKLKDDKKGSTDKGGHYYHKYDVTGTLKKETTLSKALGDGTSSIIIETMNSSFHSSSGDVNEVTTQELTMPYNIVDVSKIVPSQKSPQLPTTPAPETGSRNSSLNRTTLKNRKAAISACDKTSPVRRSESPLSRQEKLLSGKNGTDSGSLDGADLDVSFSSNNMGLDSVLQGLPPRYWHTYEPIPAKDNEPDKAANNKSAPLAAKSKAKNTQVCGVGNVKAKEISATQSVKSASVEALLEQSGDHVFSRQSASRATTPGPRGTGNDALVGNKSTLERAVSVSKPSVPRPHLDLTKPTSRSAEDLIETTSPTHGKKISPKANGNKKGAGGGFFSRLFGFGRKPSVDEENEQKSPEFKSSLQENAEFFRPLQKSPNEPESQAKSPKLSPPHIDKSDIVSDIENVLAAKQEQQQSGEKTRLNKADSNAVDNATLDASKQNKSIISARTSFLYANLPTSISEPPAVAPKPSKTVSISADNYMDTNRSPTFKPLATSSPENTMSGRLKSESLSQSSLLSDGSSDARSISSREEQGSSGDSQNLKSKRARPKSQAVSRKMLDAPPPPPPCATSSPASGVTSSPTSGTVVMEKRMSVDNDARPLSSLTVSSTSSKSVTSPKIGSPNVSPTKTPSNPFASLRGKKKSSSTSDDAGEKKQTRPKLEISAPIELQSSTLNESQTLPRPVKSASVVSESRDDTHMATGRRKRFDSVAKHARNKTFTEGVTFDPELLRESPEKNGSDSSDSKAHKYQNRALPPTPTLSHSALNTDTERKTRKSVTIQEHTPQRASYMSMNEDIYTDPIEEDFDDVRTSRRGSRDRSSQENNLIHSKRPMFSALKAPVNVLADYLEPTDNPENRPSFIKPAIAAKPVYGSKVVKTSPTNGAAPELLPRNAVTSQKRDKQNGSPETYVSMIYVNTEMIIDKTQPPLDVGDGFRCMAFINVETLLHVANTTQTEYIHQDADINDELKFSHFVLKSTKPYVNQGIVAFYNARTYKLKPADCLLMISAKYINPDLLHHSCVHMLQPSLIFSDRILATYFPDNAKTANPSDPTKSKVYQLGGMVHTNMAVITYHSIGSFADYVKENIHKKAKNGEPYERTLCYLLFQILSAVLSAHDGSSMYTVKSVNINDILVVEHPCAKDEPYIVINPLRSADFERLDDEILCTDLIKVLCGLLDLKPPSDNRNVARMITGSSRFALGMRKMADVLEKNTFSCLLVARSVMEYVLWGPSDREIKSLLLAEHREQAFCIWLEVTRCKYVNELALGQISRNLELSHMFHFLCAVTGSNLLEVTKLLYKHK